jgi:hypothetical protein
MARLDHAQPNIESQQPQDARPDDPERTTTFGKNTRPRGNGDQDERDTEKGRDKLDSVLGQ